LSNQRIAILGAGGHTRAIVSLLKQLNLGAYGIYDDSFVPDAPEEILSVPVRGTLAALPDELDVVLSFGSLERRRALYQRLRSRVLAENLISPRAFIDASAALGQSNTILGNASLGACVQVGVNNIVNASATIEHEVIVGDHCHVAVNATVCGRARIGSGCFVGAGAVIIDKVRLGDGVTIGAGGVVIEDLLAPGTYVGNPVKKVG